MIWPLNELLKVKRYRQGRIGFWTPALIVSKEEMERGFRVYYRDPKDGSETDL
jgi:hypothetical protein